MRISYSKVQPGHPPDTLRQRAGNELCTNRKRTFRSGNELETNFFVQLRFVFVYFRVGEPMCVSAECRVRLFSFIFVFSCRWANVRFSSPYAPALKHLRCSNTIKYPYIFFLTMSNRARASTLFLTCNAAMKTRFVCKGERIKTTRLETGCAPKTRDVRR